MPSARSATVAEFSGVPIVRTTVLAYTLSGLTAALAGMLLTGYTAQAYLGMGDRIDPARSKNASLASEDVTRMTAAIDDEERAAFERLSAAAGPVRIVRMKAPAMCRCSGRCRPRIEAPPIATAAIEFKRGTGSPCRDRPGRCSR